MKAITTILCFASLVSLLSSCASQGQMRKAESAPVPSADEQLDRISKEKESLVAVIRELKPQAFEEVGLYRIEPGDTGAKIAAKHGITLSDLLAMNPGVEWRRLKVWQIVRVRAETGENPPNKTPEPMSTTVTPPAGAGDRASGAPGSS